MKISNNFASASPPSYPWNSILEFDNDISKELSNDELVRLAKQGYDEIVLAYNRLQPHLYPKIKLSRAITLIVIGRKAYLASSVRGGPSYIDINGICKVRGALAQCGAEYSNHSCHRNGGNCGEQACSHLSFEKNPNQSLTGGKVWFSLRLLSYIMLTFRPFLDRDPGNKFNAQYWHRLGTVRPRGVKKSSNS